MSGLETNKAMPRHRPAAGVPPEVAMLHLTSPELTSLFTSPPLPLFFESLSLQEREV